jgi:GT2 family glycosyltransferase
MAEVTAIIPNWNGGDRLLRALASLREQTTPVSALVIDNGSTDDSANAAERLGAGVIRLGRNTGFAAAVNRGIRESPTPLVAIVNNDVELAPDWLGHLVAAMAEPGVSFATGKLFDANNLGVDSTFDLVARSGCAWRCGQGRPDGDLWNTERTIFSAPMTAAVFRRDVFHRVGELDERFESYLEDVDLGIRCALEGVSGRFIPAAHGTHQGSATLGKWSPAAVRLIARNQVFLVSKHYSRSWRARTIWRVITGQALWGLLALRHGAGGAWMQGKWEGMVRFGEFGAPHPRIDEVLAESEQLLHDLQKTAGLDTYWRVYFSVS